MRVGNCLQVALQLPGEQWRSTATGSGIMLAAAAASDALLQSTKWQSAVQLDLL